MIKNVIFDFDGTLADSKDVALSIYNQLADKYKSKQVKPEDIPSLQIMSISERCKAMNFPLYKLPALALDFSKLYRQSLPYIRLFDGIREMLETLMAKGYVLAIVSSNEEESIRTILRNNRLDFIADIHTATRLTSKESVIQKLMKARKWNPDEVLYIGDERKDIEIAKASKIKGVWASWGVDTWEIAKAATPDFIAETPDDIVKILSS